MANTRKDGNRIASRIIEMIDNEPQAAIGLGFTQSMAIFLAINDLIEPGCGDRAYNLLIAGTDKLYQAPKKESAKMREAGFDNEEIARKMLSYITNKPEEEEEQQQAQTLN